MQASAPTFTRLVVDSIEPFYTNSTHGRAFAMMSVSGDRTLTFSGASYHTQFFNTRASPSKKHPEGMLMMIICSYPIFQVGPYS
jgi:hypothetical protein